MGKLHCSLNAARCAEKEVRPEVVTKRVGQEVMVVRSDDRDRSCVPDEVSNDGWWDRGGAFGLRERPTRAELPIGSVEPSDVVGRRRVGQGWRDVRRICGACSGSTLSLGRRNSGNVRQRGAGTGIICDPFGRLRRGAIMPKVAGVCVWRRRRRTFGGIFRPANGAPCEPSPEVVHAAHAAGTAFPV